MKHIAPVAILVPYFGSWPKWFELYLKTCSMQNGLIDFYFFTDCAVPSKQYPNIYFYHYSFEQYCSKVSSVLGIEFRPTSPYKITDLRPFLGHIHKDILEGYTFWAFGDIDLLYGDMSIILSERNLRSCDVITAHSERLAGHFSAIRVDSKYSNSCFQILEWKYKLENPAHLGLDEGEFSNIINPSLRVVLAIIRRVIGNVNIERLRNLCMGIWRIFPFLCRRMSFVEYGTTPIPSDKTILKCSLDERKVEDMISKKGLPYIHFLFFKKTPYLDTHLFWNESTFYKVNDSARQVFIDCTGIHN